MGRKSRYTKWKAINPDSHGAKELLNRQKGHFNKAPQKEDFDQRPPKGFLELMDSMKEAEARQAKADVKRKKRKTDGNTANQNPKKKPKYQRRPWESDDQYLGRVDRLVTGIVSKERMDILKAGGDREAGPKRLTKEKERKLKRLKKKAAEKKKEKLKERQEQVTVMENERLLESLEEDMMQDKVEFGDVAMEPPVLTKAPRKSKDTPKPGQRELLLKGLVKEDSSKTKKTQKKPTQKTSSEGKKRKDMSTAEKLDFDERRNAVIDAYRKQRNTQRISLPIQTEESPS